MAHRENITNGADFKIDIFTVENTIIDIDTAANQAGTAEDGSKAAETPSEGEKDETEAPVYSSLPDCRLKDRPR